MLSPAKTQPRTAHTRPAAALHTERPPLGGGHLGTMDPRGVVPALILSLLGVTRTGVGGAKGKEGGERAKGWTKRPSLWWWRRGGWHRRRAGGGRDTEGWGAGPGPAVPLCSSPPPGLGGSPAARAASQLTRGAEELSGAPRPAPPVRGARKSVICMATNGARPLSQMFFMDPSEGLGHVSETICLVIYKFYL